jgi:hypothetical protein
MAAHRRRADPACHRFSYWHAYFPRPRTPLEDGLAQEVADLRDVRDRG